MQDSERDVTLSAAKGPERGLVANLLGTIRRIAGMPDYAAHVDHLRRCHPEHPIPSERQFYEEFIRTRYAEGPHRCC